MRRVLTTLSALLATAPLILAAPGPAVAATGKLIITTEGVTRNQFFDPAPGCYGLPSFRLLSRVQVINATNADVIVYSGANCRSGLLHAATRVPAGTVGERTLTGTHSVQVQPA
ncbi:hypothetical protein AB0B89_34920 [Sphaerisporangium sp. NPDC049002]|uniref:hypothetical protein n=1 Tax=unclassified Sphaerisporangium TaxID=2630420 RepID=UPI0033DFA8A8